MVRMIADKHRDAVSQCLTSCYAAHEPLKTAAAFIADLRANPEWTAEEVDAVEANTLRILKAILAPQAPS
jgi:hypothetical protein